MTLQNLCFVPSDWEEVEEGGNITETATRGRGILVQSVDCGGVQEVGNNSMRSTMLVQMLGTFVFKVYCQVEKDVVNSSTELKSQRSKEDGAIFL